ncbi:MAG: ABC transporter substrate-binding protein [Gammaproteobacteria bacterium]|nr:ABC transporter substrate-binding protein [Gammaproteobacteria bacterium]
MLDRRGALKQAGIAGILASGVAPAVHAQANIRWRMVSSFPKSLDTLFGVADVFANKVKEMTGGKFIISTHAAGEVVPAFGTIDAVKDGIAEAANTASYYYFGKDETFALSCAIPFGLNARQMNAWMYEGNGLKLMREFYSQYNIMMFPMGNTGSQMGGWFKKPIESLAQFKGTKFRVGGFAGKVVERIGGVPQNIPGGEIYQALEKGTIDAAEWVGPYDDLKLGFYKVVKNYAYPGWWEGGPQLDLHINMKAWNDLSAENKAIVTSAAAFAHLDMMGKYDYRNSHSLKQLVAEGTKLFAFPRDLMEAAFKASLEIYSELSAKNPNWKKVYEDYATYRKDANIWFSFTEASFDRFMQSRIRDL